MGKTVFEVSREVYYAILNVSRAGSEMLTGKHVLLRALERDDLKAIHKWQNDEEIMRLSRSQPDHSISMDALTTELEKNLKGEESDTRRFGIEEKSSGNLIGWCSISLNRWARRYTTADVGLCIGEKDRWHKGYGSEVVRLLLREVFEQLDLHRAVWWTHAENEGSIALARKMGFKEEGRLRENVFFDNEFHDNVVFGLLKADYQANLRTPPVIGDKSRGRMASATAKVAKHAVFSDSV